MALETTNKLIRMQTPFIQQFPNLHLSVSCSAIRQRVFCSLMLFGISFSGYDGNTVEIAFYSGIWTFLGTSTRYHFKAFIIFNETERMHSKIRLNNIELFINSDILIVSIIDGEIRLKYGKYLDFVNYGVSL